MNIKIKIKFYLFTKNYLKLKRIIVENENALKYLNEKDVEQLLEYAANTKDFMLFNTILLDISDEKSATKQEVADKYIKKYLPTLFHNPIFLYSVASIISKNYEKYPKEIKLITNFISTSPLNNIFIYIHNLDGFYTEEMENKILASDEFHFFSCLLESANYETKKHILKKIIEKNPNSEKLYQLTKLLKNEGKLGELREIILRLELSKEKKGASLLTIYAGIKKDLDDIDFEFIIDDIIQLNDFNTTDKLMSKLNKEDMSKIIEKYFYDPNKEIIFTLACTTNCEKTPSLINKILSEIDKPKLVALIMLVKECYLPQIYEQVLIDEGTCLNIINELYLFGSNRWINIINYITTKNKDLISPSKIKEIESFIEKKEKYISRKRILT